MAVGMPQGCVGIHSDIVIYIALVVFFCFFLGGGVKILNFDFGEIFRN